MRLKEQVAIITGSTRGIGRGIARRFAQEGCHVIINGHRREDVETVCREIEAMGTGARAVAAPADVSREEQVESIFDVWRSNFDRLDILVNNAGIWQSTPFNEMRREEWDTVLGVHLQGFFYCTRRAVDIMVPQRSGNIVSISSVSDLRAHENAAAYDAAKGAILAGTRAIAVDLGIYGIRVNAISPGPIYVENWDNFTTPEKLERAAQQVVLRRIGKPEDVAGAAVFLVSEDASFITGQTIYVDGGLSAQARPPGGQAT